MRAIFIVIFGFAVVALGHMSPARANLVQNGNFSAGFSDWNAAGANITDNAGQLTQTPNALTTNFLNNGNQSDWGGIDNGFGTLEQNIPTVPGQLYNIQYVFSFSAETCNAGGCTPSFSPGTFLMFFNGAPFLARNSWLAGAPPTPAPPDALATHTFIGPSGAYEYLGGTYIEDFTGVATGASTPLEFAASAVVGDFSLSSVEVTAVPEPSTIALLIPLLLGFVAIGRRRKPAAPHI